MTIILKTGHFNPPGAYYISRKPSNFLGNQKASLSGQGDVTECHWPLKLPVGHRDWRYLKKVAGSLRLNGLDQLATSVCHVKLFHKG